MSTFSPRVLLPLLLALSLLACGPAPGDPELTCDPARPAVTLAGGLQAQVFDACAGCHASGYLYGDYTSATATAAATVNQKSRYAGMAGTLQVVAPNDLANSSLWLKVLGGTARGRTGPKNENVFGKMPNDGTDLSSEQKQRLKDWICSGAK